MARNNQGDRDNSRRNTRERGEAFGGVATIAREQPARAAAIAAAAVGAGVFLWSRRNQISEQISSLSNQFNQFSQGSGSNESGSFDNDTAGLTTANTGSAGMSETGGGNASLGASSGGGGTAATSSATGRGQVRQSPTT